MTIPQSFGKYRVTRLLGRGGMTEVFDQSLAALKARAEADLARLRR